MTFHNGYRDIGVKLLEFPHDIFLNAYKFGMYGRGNKVEIDDSIYTQQDMDCFVDEILCGESFPKYCLEQRLVFEVNNISRIVLAQLTRDRAFFCSESGGVRPLTQDIIMPSNIYNDQSIMDKVTQAQELLESAYIEALEKGIPYPDARYIGLHSQTISLTVAFTIGDFRRACHSRTNNSFCDELNYVYRKMLNLCIDEIDHCSDRSQKILRYFINKSCIDDDQCHNLQLYNGDFQYGNNDGPDYMYAINDWTKSAWKIELERIYCEEPELLTTKERDEIRCWMFDEKEGRKLDSTFDADNPRSGQNLIKEMPYYEKRHESE